MAREASLVEQDLLNDLERRMCEEAVSNKREKLMMVGLLAGRLTVMWKSCQICHPRLVSTSTNHHPPAPRHGLAESRLKRPTAEGARRP